jgi:hypothetical protein
MKFLLLRKFIWLILFTLVHLWFMLFNWQLFITMLNVNLGLGVVRLPPFVILFLTGFVILTIQSWTGYVNKLHRIIHELEDELAQRNKDPKSSRSSGPGVDRLAGTKMGSRPEVIQGDEQSSKPDRTQKDPAEKDNRKEEMNRPGLNSKDSKI